MSPSARRAAAWAARWGEVGLTAAAALLGLWLFADSAANSLFRAVVGLGLMILALLNLRGAVARARLAAGGEGPGVLLFDEGQIAWLGPDAGGIVALDTVDRLALSDGPDGAVLHVARRGGPPLEIPLAARGAEALIDALAALPGFDPARLAETRRRAGRAPETVWVRALDTPGIARHR